MLVDDKPSHVAAWAENNPRGIGLLMDAPYNRDPLVEGNRTAGLRVTWDAVAEVLR